MKKDMKKVPVGALNLTDSHEIQFMFSGVEGEKPTMTMEGYSGGVIKDHWYWGNLAIDLEGMEFPKKKYPILKDHDTSKIIGFASKPKTDDKKLTLDDITICDTQDANEFIALSKQGVPFEASIYAKPTSIERVDEDETVDVNGYKFKGPGTIWRKSTFKECSVCVFGYDSNTSSVAMSEGGETLDLSQFIAHTDEKPASSEEPIMTLKELQEKDPEGYKKLTEEIAAAANSQFSAIIEEKDKAIVELTNAKAAFGESNKTLEEKFNDLAKKFELVQEKSLASTASAIVATKLSECDLNDRIKQKITKFTDYSKFVKEDKLDTDAFSAALDAEIKDYKEMFGEVVPAIQGGAGTQSRDLGNAGDKFTEEDAEAYAKKMAAAAGITTK